MRLALCFCALSLGCIERAYETGGGAPPRPQVDRSLLRDVLQPPPSDATPVGAIFGNAAELIAYKLEPPVLAPAQRYKLTLYWRCRAELDPLHIFVHLDDATGSGERIHAEHDPAGGRFPTNAWQPGDHIADSFWFIPATRSFPDGGTGTVPLLLFLGFYSTGENRLTLTSPGRGRDDGNNRLLAGVLPAAR